MTSAYRREITRWMERELREDIDRLSPKDGGDLWDHRTDEANLTALAEAAAHAHGHDEWLDDPDHWVWDAAIVAADRVKRAMRGKEQA